jgi:hypothetical protein
MSLGKASGEEPSEGAPRGEKKGPTKLWLPVVLTVGVLAGLALSYLVPEPFFIVGVGPGFADRLRDAVVLHMILSTVSIALLVALIAIYLKVFAETGARFALGILIVMLALLMESLFQYPLLLGLYAGYPVDFGPFLSSADLFTIAAYTIFLYLSLE